MNRITLCLLLCLAAATATARDGFSLSAGYGAGFSYQRNADANAYIYGGSPWSFSSALAQQAQLAVSYHAGHWVVTTGISYLRGGYTRTTTDYYPWTTLSYYQANGNLVLLYGDHHVTETMLYRHIVIPFTLGYEFRLGKKLSLTPAAGYNLSYNLPLITRFREDDTRRTSQMSAEQFNKGYHRTSSWLAARALVSYPITPRLSIFGGPHLYWMLTRLNRDNDQNYEWGRFRLHNITFDAGVSLRLRNKRVKE